MPWEHRVGRCNSDYRAVEEEDLEEGMGKARWTWTWTHSSHGLPPEGSVCLETQKRLMHVEACGKRASLISRDASLWRNVSRRNSDFTPSPGSALSKTAKSGSYLQSHSFSFWALFQNSMVPSLHESFAFLLLLKSALKKSLMFILHPLG